MARIGHWQFLSNFWETSKFWTPADLGYIIPICNYLGFWRLTITHELERRCAKKFMSYRLGYCVFQAALGYVNTQQSGSEHARADQQCIVNEHFAKQ